MEYFDCPKLANHLNLGLLKFSKVTHNYDLSKVNKMSNLKISFIRAAVEEAITVKYQKIFFLLV